MSNGSRTRSGQDKVRAWCHQAIDKVANLADNRLQAAESVLDKASSDSVRQKLVELSVSESDEITAVFVRAAIRQGTTQLARAAADLLMDIKSADSALTVIKECLDADDLSVKRRAVEAIETLEDPSALDLLADALESEEDGVRRAATNSFGLVIGSKYHDLAHHILNEIEDPESRLFQVIAGSKDISLRREIAQSLGFARSDRVLPLLKKMAHDPDRQTRRESVLALAAIKTDQSTEILRDLLKDPDGLVVASVLDALAARYGRDSTRMLGALKQALDHPDSKVRRHAVLMLNQFPPADVRELLEQAAHDDAFEVQRSANSLLRVMRAGSGLTGMDKDRSQQTDNERTLSIWEAGNIGIESDAAKQHSMLESHGQATAEEVVPILEKTAKGNFHFIRQHALTELIDLCDIADSPALQQGLFDDDESIRSRVAPALESTRDAGLLIELLETHNDANIRRRAVEALMDNPSGYTQGGIDRKRLTFSAERSEGMIFFSYFLNALGDEDEGVRQLACRAIGEFVEFDCPIPVAETRRRLEDLDDDPSVSSLTHEIAQNLLDDLEEASLSEPVVNAMESVPEWTNKLVTHLQSMEPTDNDQYVLNRDCGIESDDLRELWEEGFGMAPDVVDEAVEAFEEGNPLPNDAVQNIIPGLRNTIEDALISFHHASGALVLIGEAEWSQKAGEWAESLRNGLQMNSVDDSEVGPSNKRLQRLRARASLAAQTARETLSDNPDYTEIHTTLKELDDEWIEIAGLTMLSEWADEDIDVDDLAERTRKHCDDPAFAVTTGRASLVLLQHDHYEALDWLQNVLPNVDTDVRCELTQNLMAIAQWEEIGNHLQEHLTSASGSGLGQLCMALALRGAMGDVIDADDIATDNEDDDFELQCAVHALGAMDNQEKHAVWLKDKLRNGDQHERYAAASYLGLARVHSALPVWASVSDQVDSAWDLRVLNAAMLVRHGHRLGIRWFAKNAEQRPSRQKPPMATQLARAVEEIIPLMYQCRTINLGRFV